MTRLRSGMAGLGADGASSYHQASSGLRVLSALFPRPSTWGPLSPEAPDVVLVSKHEEVKKLRAGRASAGRSPPAFAVATPPFLRLLETLLFAVKHNHAILLEGTTALGKSFAVRTLASLLGVRLRSLNVHPAVSDEDLLGSLQPNPHADPLNPSDQILVFKDGHLVQAMEAGDFFAMEELNMGSTGAVETLNFYLSHNKIFVQRNGHLEQVKIHPRFRLFATQNPKHYGARQQLSRPFLSRWIRWILGFKDAAEEQEHLVPTLMVLNGFTNSVGLQLVQIHQAIAKNAPSWQSGHARGDPYEFDQRHLLRMAERLPELIHPDGTPKKLEELAPEDKKAIAVSFWNTYGLSLREAKHRQNLFALLEHHLQLKDLGIENAEALDQLTFEHLRDGKKDTDEELQKAGAALGIPSTEDARSRIPGEDYALKAVPSQRRVWWAILDSFKNNENVLLTGPHAAGKTSLIFALFHLLGKPLYYFNLHDTRSIDDMVGTIVQAKDGKFKFVPGPLVQAMRAGAAFFVDELNLSELPEWLNTVMDTGELALPDGTIVKAQKGFRILAAMNPPTEQGRRTLSPALRSRWREVWVPEITKAKELRQIVKEKLGAAKAIQVSRPEDLNNPDEDITTQPLDQFLVKLHKDLKKQFPKQGYSLRELNRLAAFVSKEALQLGLHSIVMGLTLVYGKQLGLADQERFQEWLEKMLGIPSTSILDRRGLPRI